MREPGTAHEVGGATPIHGRRRVDLMVALVAYLGLAVAVWWGVWSTHPTSVTTCGCGDSALFLWFLDWPAVALAHGHNPFFSTAMFHPTGVNLLANTSETAIGLALAPVTWIFGPVATLNVALTLAPALSAWAMYWLVRRWVDWRPAAFAAGLLYGFSPFVLSSLADAHLMNGFLLVPPLVVGVLDELLVRQGRLRGAHHALFETAPAAVPAFVLRPGMHLSHRPCGIVRWNAGLVRPVHRRASLPQSPPPI